MVWVVELNVQLVHPESPLRMLISISRAAQAWYFFTETFAPVPVHICDIFFIFEAVTFSLLQLCLDIMLLLRSKSGELSSI